MVTTKYNPARTWTAENSVGIGGAYLCIYGMEGPGGISSSAAPPSVEPLPAHRAVRTGQPVAAAVLRPDLLDPVSAEELLDMRADMAAGRGQVDITEGTFSLAEHQEFLADNAVEIAAFRDRQAAAFAAERAAWERAGEFDRAERAAANAPANTDDLVLQDGDQRIDAPFSSSVWKVDVAIGDRVVSGQPLLALEAMKMETVLRAPADGIVTQVLVSPASRRPRHPAGGRRHRGASMSARASAVRAGARRLRRDRGGRSAGDLDHAAAVGRLPSPTPRPSTPAPRCRWPVWSRR